MLHDIGNQVATAEGSVEYGVHHLHTPLLMLDGHSMCGAVKVAMGDYSKMAPAIKRDLDSIHVSAGNSEDSISVMHAVEENVNKQVEHAIKMFQQELTEGKLIIIGAVCDFRNDYKHGYGCLVLTNVNDEKDPNKIMELIGFSKDAIVE